MSNWNTLSDIRREYGELSLSKESAESSPIAQFEKWFSEILKTAIDDPTAMVLSTIDSNGHPDSRVVLLKGVEHDAFLFYTNYRSTKANQINSTPHVALNFYWPHMARQVRIKGLIEKLDDSQSDEYFSSRPLASQLSAIASPQSQPIKDRDELEQSIQALISKNQELIMRPEYWGGYRVIPDEIEFWQGRDNRLHDRILYIKKNKKWENCRIAP